MKIRRTRRERGDRKAKDEGAARKLNDLVP